MKPLLQNIPSRKFHQVAQTLFLSSILLLFNTISFAQGITIAKEGKVLLEMIGSNTAASNTISLVKVTKEDGSEISMDNIRIAKSGCKIIEDQTWQGQPLTGLQLMSEKLDRRGCHVWLDSDSSTEGLIDAFPANTTFIIEMCSDSNKDGTCEKVWSTNVTDNFDGFDHVRIEDVHTGNEHAGTLYLMKWEDQTNGGDMDFSDLSATLRVANDTDGDGLFDDWETEGIDINGDGRVDLDLKAKGADPMKKDIFVELDYMDCAKAYPTNINYNGEVVNAHTEVELPVCSDNHTHQPLQSVLDEIVTAFANSDVTNPDGTTGIKLHLELGNAVPHYQYFDLNEGIIVNGLIVVAPFNLIKQDNANFGRTNPKRFAYHYGIMGHAKESGSSGTGELPGNDFLVTLGGWTPDDPQNLDMIGEAAGQVIDNGRRMTQAGTIMHELGHNLNLRHGGSNNVNYKPNYVSIMNYTFQLKGIPMSDGTRLLDYSTDKLPDLDETALPEFTGITGSSYSNPAAKSRFFCNTTSTTIARSELTSEQKPFFEMGNSVDWDCDGFQGTTAEVTVQANINNDNQFSTLTGWDDWSNIQYSFHAEPDFEDGVHASVVDLEEPTEEELDLVATSTQHEEIPVEKYALDNNYPNPFRTHTTIRFEAPATAHAKLVVYDILGREAEVLIDDVVQQGQHYVNFDASALSSGIYFYHLQTAKEVITKSMLILK